MGPLRPGSGHGEVRRSHQGRPREVERKRRDGRRTVEQVSSRQQSHGERVSPAKFQETSKRRRQEDRPRHDMIKVRDRVAEERVQLAIAEKSAQPAKEGASVTSTTQVATDYSSLGVKELKDLLTAAGVSFVGATEKNDLVRLLVKTRAQAATRAGAFCATKSWRLVPDGVSMPPGLEVKFDLQKGCTYARMVSTPKSMKTADSKESTLHALLAT